MMARLIFGVPYLALRTAIRSKNHVMIRSMYMDMIIRYHASNKIHCAKLCILSLHTQHILKPEVRDIWNRMRTASFRGNVGRQVGWDFALERINLEVANALGSDISGPRIEEVIREFKGIRHVRGPAFSAFGLGDGGEMSEYNGIADTDVLAIVHHL